MPNNQYVNIDLNKESRNKNRNLSSYQYERNPNDRASYIVCKYNENHEKQGKGYVFANNAISSIVEYNENEVIRIMKTFENNEMNEYDESGELLYCGEFLNDLSKDFPRNGKGNEYQDGQVVYDGNWKMNKKTGYGISYQNGHTLYDGFWFNNLPHGQGIIYKLSGDILHQGIWNKGRLKTSMGVFDYALYTSTPDFIAKHNRRRYLQSIICRVLLWLFLFILLLGLAYFLYILIITKIVRTKEDLLNLDRDVKRIRIPSNSCNEEDLTDVRWIDYPKLEQIVVGDNCFMNVKDVMIHSLHSLKKITIGKNSFTGIKNHENHENHEIIGEFSLLNCSRLTSLTFDQYSFTDYSFFTIQSRLNSICRIIL